MDDHRGQNKGIIINYYVLNLEKILYLMSFLDDEMLMLNTPIP